VVKELDRQGLIDHAPTVTGRTLSQDVAAAREPDGEVIRPFDRPLKEKAGFLVLSGNLFDAAIMKTSVISESFAAKYLHVPGHENVIEGNAVVFDGAEDYRARINDPDLPCDEHSILVVRGAGPIGHPGAAEVVNMQPPDRLIRNGIRELPTIGDGRQSGTSNAPSILNASPEAAAGGGLARLKTGDRLVIDLNKRTANADVPEAEWNARKPVIEELIPESQTPWQALYREKVGPLSTGMCFDFAVAFQKVRTHTPRNSH
jgi:dihydroxy-acid dehydratase